MTSFFPNTPSYRLTTRERKRYRREMRRLAYGFAVGGKVWKAFDCLKKARNG